jgi:hypothetical protein
MMPLKAFRDDQATRQFGQELTQQSGFEALLPRHLGGRKLRTRQQVYKAMTARSEVEAAFLLASPTHSNYAMD